MKIDDKIAAALKSHPHKYSHPRIQPVKYRRIRIGLRECMVILKKHHEDLKDDPDRLSTEFIARLSGCTCGMKVTDYIIKKARHNDPAH